MSNVNKVMQIAALGMSLGSNVTLQGCGDLTKTEVDEPAQETTNDTAAAEKAAAEKAAAYYLSRERKAVDLSYAR